MTEFNPIYSYSVTRPFYIVCTQSVAKSAKQTVFVKIGGLPKSTPTTKGVIDLLVNHLNANVKCVEPEHSGSITYHSYQTNEFVMLDVILDDTYNGFIIYNADNDQTLFVEANEDLSNLFLRLKSRDEIDMSSRCPAVLKAEGDEHVLHIPKFNHPSTYHTFRRSAKGTIEIPNFQLARSATKKECNIYVKSNSKFSGQVYSLDNVNYRFSSFFNITRPDVVFDITTQKTPGAGFSRPDHKFTPLHAPWSIPPGGMPTYPGDTRGVSTSQSPVFKGFELKKTASEHVPEKEDTHAIFPTGLPGSQTSIRPSPITTSEKLRFPTVRLHDSMYVKIADGQTTTLKNCEITIKLTIVNGLLQLQIRINGEMVIDSTMLRGTFTSKVIDYKNNPAILFTNDSTQYILSIAGKMINNYIKLAEINYMFSIFSANKA